MLTLSRQELQGKANDARPCATQLSAFFIEKSGNQRCQDGAHPEVKHPPGHDPPAEGRPGRHGQAQGETHGEAHEHSHACRGDRSRPAGGARGCIHPGQDVSQDEQRHEPVDDEEVVAGLGQHQIMRLRKFISGHQEPHVDDCAPNSPHSTACQGTQKGTT